MTTTQFSKLSTITQNTFKVLAIKIMVLDLMILLYNDDFTRYVYVPLIPTFLGFTYVEDQNKYVGM